MGMYQSAQGIANVVAGWLTGPALNILGQGGQFLPLIILSELYDSLRARPGITFVGNFLQTASFVGTGLAQSGASLLGALALRAPVNENSAVQAMLAAQAKRLNIGQGRLASDVANFVALTKIVTPMMYSWGARNGKHSHQRY